MVDRGTKGKGAGIMVVGWLGTRRSVSLPRIRGHWPRVAMVAGVAFTKIQCIHCIFVDVAEEWGGVLGVHVVHVRLCTSRQAKYAPEADP